MAWVKVPNSGQKTGFDVHDLGTLTVFGNHDFPKFEIIDFPCEGDRRLC